MCAASQQYALLAIFATKTQQSRSLVDARLSLSLVSGTMFLQVGIRIPLLAYAKGEAQT